MSVGLTQRNLDNGYDFLMEVSHPESPNYGKHWSMDKIKETFAPSKGTIAAVKTWLIESGLESERIKMSKSLTWVKFDATVEEAESLLKTEYNIYTHATTGKDSLACEDYSVPAYMQEHVDFITPTVQFDAMVELKAKRTDLQGRGLKVKPTSQLIPDPLRVPLSEVTFNLTNCNRYITPECLRAFSSYAVVEYTPQAYLQPDLDLFYSTLAPQIANGTGPIIDLIDGADVKTEFQDFGVNGESDLDLEYSIALVYPQQVTLYQTGDEWEGASFNNLLDALDGSYCTSGGGDDPIYDALYPDPYGGYQGPEDCGTFAPASVISTSYAYNEADLPAAYEQRQCNEYLKLGLAGVTILYSSGDYGVAGNSGECCVLPGCEGGELNGGGEGAFNPSFPGTCPYITSVGATQIKHDYSVTATNPEAAWETVIYSGGGFSNVFPLPDYQSSAVGTYYKTHKPKYNSTIYNDSQAAGALNDITLGDNQGCGTQGFRAVKGWDPLTGLGTPNFPKLLEVFMALP